MHAMSVMKILLQGTTSCVLCINIAACTIWTFPETVDIAPAGSAKVYYHKVTETNTTQTPTPQPQAEQSINPPSTFTPVTIIRLEDNVRPPQYIEEKPVATNPVPAETRTHPVAPTPARAPIAAPVETVVNDVKPHQHEVQNGETLHAIALRYDMTLSVLAQANRIDPPYLIYPGMLLALPNSANFAQLSEETPETPTPEPPDRAAEPDWIWPLSGTVIQYFDLDQNQKGIDIASAGQQTVSAAQAGTVAYADDEIEDLGKTIIVQHEQGYVTIYAHNSRLLVMEKEHVRQGQAIAEIDREDPGRLHFQIRRKGKPVDPLKLLPPNQ